MCVYPRTHTRTQIRPRLPCWPRSPQGSVLRLLEWKEPSLAPAAHLPAGVHADFRSSWGDYSVRAPSSLPP